MGLLDLFRPKPKPSATNLVKLARFHSACLALAEAIVELEDGWRYWGESAYHQEVPLMIEAVRHEKMTKGEDC